MIHTNFWHFVRDNGHLSHDMQHIKAEKGRTYYVNKNLELGKTGLHASRLPSDAMFYARGSLLCSVTLSGHVLHRDTLSVATERTITEIKDIKLDIIKYIMNIAELNLLLPNNLIDAIQTAREYNFVFKSVPELFILNLERHTSKSYLENFLRLSLITLMYGRTLPFEVYKLFKFYPEYKDSFDSIIYSNYDNLIT